MINRGHVVGSERCIQRRMGGLQSSAPWFLLRDGWGPAIPGEPLRTILDHREHRDEEVRLNRAIRAPPTPVSAVGPIVPDASPTARELFVRFVARLGSAWPLNLYCMHESGRRNYSPRMNDSINCAVSALSALFVGSISPAMDHNDPSKNALVIGSGLSNVMSRSNGSWKLESGCNC